MADTAAKQGDLMPAGHPYAGWIYAGVSETTKRDFYVAANDVQMPVQWLEAKRLAAERGSRLPSEAELDQLYRLREVGALKGTFNRTGWNQFGWHWTSGVSETTEDYARSQSFVVGNHSWSPKSEQFSLRLVRG